MTAETHDLDADDVNDDATLDMEMALFAMSASDVGGPLQDIDLSALSVEEKRALLAYLRHRFNFAPDPQELSEVLAKGEEPGSAPANDTPV
ncbi:MAG: hypothetical protein H8F28_27865 [Fibrella sp.]|nr:hypothetical protein [Armatimonadota bacterium]